MGPEITVIKTYFLWAQNNLLSILLNTSSYIWLKLIQA